MAQEKDVAFPSMFNKFRAPAIKSCIKKNLLSMVIGPWNWLDSNKYKAAEVFETVVLPKRTTNIN